MAVLGKRIIKAGLAFVLAVTGFSAPTDAIANTAECRALKSQLASLATTGNPTQARRYEQALRRQLVELHKAELMSRSSRCNRSNAAQCVELNITISQMRANVSSLRATRDRYTRQRGSASQRSALRAKINAACNTQVAALAEEMDPQRQRLTLYPQGSTEAPQRLTSGYRSLCVRSCDGYFFPVAFESGAPSFARNQAACSAMCPGTDVSVFVHRVPDQETGDMVDVRGLPYTSLENAYAYLQPDHINARPSSCSCRGAAGLDVQDATPVPEGLLKTIVTGDGEKKPLPAPRPDLHADPETRMNAGTGLTLEIVRQMTENLATGEETEIVSRDPVRVVLPGFLPDPEAAEDPPVQDPTSGQ